MIYKFTLTILLLAISAVATQAVSRPNIILLIADDQRRDQANWLPEGLPLRASYSVNCILPVRFVCLAGLLQSPAIMRAVQPMNG
jgi:hypothetical protein